MKAVFLFLPALLIFGCFKEKRSSKAGARMQDFIVAISDHAKQRDPDFAIIPQNGIELLFDDLDEASPLNERLIGAIDGIGIESLFFEDGYEPDDYRLGMARKAAEVIPVFVSDYVSNNDNIAQSLQHNTAEGFRAFPRSSANYDYLEIPPVPYQENAENVKRPSEARNYLYLISTDGYQDKESFLEAIRQTNYDMVIIDAFYGEEWLTAAEVASLKIKANGASRIVIAYMNVGAAEKYRYYWQDDWKLHRPRWLKKEYDGYEDEIWVKFWKTEWQDIIYGKDDSYTDHLLGAGFDGAYLDNVEAFYFLYYDD
jgi:cysteinyl-tRNA synthetase, unknown class